MMLLHCNNIVTYNNIECVVNNLLLIVVEADAAK